LAIIQREQSKPECVVPSEEAISLYHRIGDQATEAISAFNLGHAYMLVPALRNLDQAERWYRRSLELRDKRDRKGRGGCLAQLGQVAYERFKEVRAANLPTSQPVNLLNSAVQSYHQALDLLPPNAADNLVIVHGQLGNIYGDAGDLDRALHHYRESIRYAEAANNLYEAARYRFNAAITLANAGRFQDALDYAQAALRNYSTFGDRAAAEIQQTQQLIAQIEQDLRGKK
jgi:tetratricopeptide (TPR) repeat protein